MPDLKQSLSGHDLGYIKIIAERWGLSLDSTDPRKAISAILPNLLDINLLTEVIEALPEKARHGLYTLVKNDGKVPWSQFTRVYGQVREMGPGRRDRERPDRNPTSVVEILWYLGLVGRAFFDSPHGTEEFAYIPSDLCQKLPEKLFSNINELNQKELRVIGRAARTSEHHFVLPVTDRILDHTVTLLAALRIGELIPFIDPDNFIFVHKLVELSGILDQHGQPKPDETKNFLEIPRNEALVLLFQTWVNSGKINDLHFVPNLKPEGEWKNDPLETREFILGLISELPEGKWWCLSSFVADIKQQFPDFQRPAGDYDSWFIRDKKDGEYLRGFKSWDFVEGELIRYIITGPCHWLGILELASTDDSSEVTAFRNSNWAKYLLAGEPPLGITEDKDQVHIRSDGRISATFRVPRAIRYQIARFCSWEDETPYEYRYQLTPKSLTRALDSGLKISHLLALLQHHADSIPPNILTALMRWDDHGSEVRIEMTSVLRLGTPELLDKLRASRAARYLGDPLGPTAVIVKLGTEEKVLAVLSEMGLFGEITSNL